MESGAEDVGFLGAIDWLGVNIILEGDSDIGRWVVSSMIDARGSLWV